MRYDTQALIAQTKRIESIPTNQSTFEDEDFVMLLDGELTNTIVPLIQRTNEEYFVVSRDVVVTPQTSEISIPPEATGLRLRDVLHVGSDGSFSKVPRLTTEQIGGGSYYGGYHGLNGFYLQNNKVMLYPANTAHGTIRLLFFRRPAHLCEVSEAGQVLSIDTLANTVTLDNAPSGWTTGTKLDVLSGDVPFVYVDEDVSIVNKAGFDIELPADVIANISVGDIVSGHGEAPVAQYIPVEAYQLLCQTTAMRCLESLGDRQGWANAAAKYAAMERDFLAMINPRIAGSPKKIVGAGGIVEAIG